MPIVIDVQVVAVRTAKALDEQVREVTGVLKVQVYDQIGRTESERALGGHKKAAGRDRVPRQVDDLYDRAVAASPIADDQVGQAVERGTRCTCQFEIFVIVRVARLIDANLVEEDIARTGGLGRRLDQGQQS
jgi:hypothetical protein